MPCVFREQARSYRGLGFSLAFCGGWAGAIASKLAPTGGFVCLVGLGISPGGFGAFDCLGSK
jgi:hypothetical protein